MIDYFLCLIDRLIKLKEYKDKRIRKLFEQILEPIFNDLLMIHADYINMFETLQRRLSEFTKKDLDSYGRIYEETVTYFGERRREYEPVRVKLRSMIGEIELLRFNPEVEQFMDALREYLPQEHLLLVQPTSGLKWRRLFEREPGHAWDPSFGRFIRRSPSGRLWAASFKKLQEGKLTSRLERNYWARVVSEFRDNVTYTLRERRQKWAYVCEAFARLKVAVLL